MGWHAPHSKTLYRKPLGFVLVEFFGDNITLGARVDVGPGHFQGLIMEFKILIGIFCALLAVVFAVGALSLALGIGPFVFSLCTVAVSGAGLFVVSGLLGD